MQCLICAGNASNRMVLIHESKLLSEIETKNCWTQLKRICAEASENKIDRYVHDEFGNENISCVPCLPSSFFPCFPDEWAMEKLMNSIMFRSKFDSNLITLFSVLMWIKNEPVRNATCMLQFRETRKAFYFWGLKKFITSVSRRGLEKEPSLSGQRENRAFLLSWWLILFQKSKMYSNYLPGQNVNENGRQKKIPSSLAMGV